MIRTLLPALRDELFRTSVAVALVTATVVGSLLALGLKELIPSRPSSPRLAGIAATTFIILAIQGLALLNFGKAASSARAYSCFSAWLKTVLLAGGALSGVFLTGILSDSPRIALITWAYCAGFTGLMGAFYGLLSLTTGRRGLALQVVLVVAVLANSALFWSRGPITAFSSLEGHWTQQLPDATMKLSPPLALAGAWHQEGGNESTREGSRFDIIRAPLAYDVWIGSYQTVPYPEVMPRSSTAGTPFHPGLLLALLIWSLPLLIFTEVLHARNVHLAK